MLFYGPSGAGKKTRIAGTLLELFGKGVERVRLPVPSTVVLRLSKISCTGLWLQLKIDQRVFLTPTKRKLDVNIVQSNYHIEITPRSVFSPSYLHVVCVERETTTSEVGNYDRVVIQEILKEIAQTQQVDLSAKQKFKRASLFHSFDHMRPIISPGMCYSRCHPRSRLPDTRRPSRPTSNNGEVHVQHASHPLRQQHQQAHRAHQESVSARARRSAHRRLGACVPLFLSFCASCI